MGKRARFGSQCLRSYTLVSEPQHDSCFNVMATSSTGAERPLQSLLGYTAESAGLVLSGGGVLLLFMMPVIGFLSSKVQARYLIAVG